MFSGLRGGVFLSMMRNFRIAWFGGRYGAGKTALALRVGIEFLERGWSRHLVANFPAIVADDLSAIEDVRDTFIILDEAGVWLSAAEFDEITAFLRKRNLYVVLASVLPVPLRAKTLNLQRTFNGQSLGLPFWHYSGVLQYMNIKEKLSLTWYRPSEVFGLYDTSYVTADDAGIVRWVVDAFVGDVNNGNRRIAGGGRAGDGSGGARLARVDEGGRAVIALDEVAEKFAESISVSGRRRGRRR